MTETCLQDIDVVILAGGLGTRISDTLGDTPKLLAPIGGTPFLEILLARLRHFGARRVVLGLGHLSAQVKTYLQDQPKNNLDIVTTVEPKPLGTAGAFRFLATKIESDPVLVMNGDSFIAADLCAFLDAHKESGADGSILVTEIEDAVRFGRVELSLKGRVKAFREKNPEKIGPGTINAGVYLFNAAMIARIGKTPGSSLERDVFQSLEPGTLNAVKGDGPFIDIGTPEDLALAEKVLVPFSPS